MAHRIVYYVDRGDKAGLVTALDSGIGDVHFVDVNGQSLLHAASVKTVPPEIAEELIRRGIDVDLQDEDGATAILYAAEWKRKDIAEIILNVGGRLDIADEHGNQPLWYAVGNPRPDYALIELFMRHGADPHHRNKYGKCPLDIAREDRGNPQMLRLLGGMS